MSNTPYLKASSKAAGGWGALKSVARRLMESGRPVSGAQTLLKLNQDDGFDCPGCAWGDPEHGSSFEFCENGVKAVAWEATKERVGPEFFAAHTVSELQTWSDYELEQQGRLTHPLRYNSETDRYEAVSWEAAFEGIAAALNALEDPNQAEFYTSGRASNEAAFLYQLMVRLFGTNNFPDCSNMCHEASGVALTQAIGSGKGTVTLEDFEACDLVYCVGQNPGTNHPRMLATLREVVARGGQVCVFNTLKEKGLTRFADPQNKLEMVQGGSKPTSTSYYQPRLGGDMAVFRGMSKVVLERGEIDQAFIESQTAGFENWRAKVEATSWETIEAQSGLTRAQIEDAAELYLASERVIVTWAMGITQHLHSVDTIREIASFMFLRGHIGRAGAGLCPVRGHSNVQGDRTMGINEKAPAALIDALERDLGVSLPRAPGHNVAAALGAMMSGQAKAFVALGGNFARAVPDSGLIADAFAKLDLTVSVGTKLNHSHLMTGKQSYLLPCLGRTEIDKNTKGERQMITVEDSMSMVHGSSGINLPASKSLKSEVAIIAGLAEALLGSNVVNWAQMAEDHDAIRDMIARVIPGFEGFNDKVRVPRGFWLENPASGRIWNTADAKAVFGDAELPEQTEWQKVDGKAGEFVLQTLRSHDQYNTTIYGMDDRYRGVYGRRDVVFMNAQDVQDMGLSAGELVTISSGSRELSAQRVVPFDMPRGCVAGYYPEMNVLVPLEALGAQSDTPTSKSVRVRITK